MVDHKYSLKQTVDMSGHSHEYDDTSSYTMPILIYTFK